MANNSIKEDIFILFLRRELEKRPVSSGYIQAHDLSTVPEPRSIIPPFEDVLKFKSQYEEDGLYIDLVRILLIVSAPATNMSPSGPGNIGDIDFSHSKAQAPRL